MPLSSESPYGHPLSTNVGGTVTRVAVSVATMTALKALVAANPARTHGNEVMVDADQSVWYFHSSSVLTGDDILVATPAAGTGCWLRRPGAVCLEMPIACGMSDHTALLTLPTGCAFKLESAHWRITTGFSGGSSSAIGIQSTSFATAGDILGGASGELTATIGTAGRKAGTVGVKLDTVAEIHADLFAAAEVFYYEKITSTYDAGAGFACLVGTLIANPGA